MKVINVVKSYSYISPYFDAETESVEDYAYYYVVSVTDDVLKEQLVESFNGCKSTFKDMVESIYYDLVVKPNHSISFEDWSMESGGKDFTDYMIYRMWKQLNVDVICSE